MLIVVAIIAILIAVSIPLINNALNKAKHATDAANERAAKAEILLQYMADGSGIEADKNYYYDAASGSLKDWDDALVKYGKHDGSTNKHADSLIAILVTKEGVVYMKWVDDEETSELSANGHLCSSETKADHS